MQEKMKILFFYVMLAATSLVGVCRGATFNLAGNSDDAVVVTADISEPSTCLAAAELTNFVQRITGRSLQISSTSSAARRVVIGVADKIADLPEAAQAALAATDNPEASWTGTDGSTLWLAGKSDVAELYATYRFIESKLGVRWFKGATDDDPGDYVPTASALAIEPFAEFREPDFRIRRLDKCAANIRPIAYKGESTAVRSGFQVAPPYGTTVPYDAPSNDFCQFYGPRYPRRFQQLGGNHTTFLTPMPTNTFFQSHPEYFAEVGGVRTCKNQQYCLSNPDVRSNVAAYVIGQLDTWNGDGFFRFGMWDSPKDMCECTSCTALDPASAPLNEYSTPNVSTRFGLSVDDMAAQIWAKYPQATLHMWAYLTYRRPPVGVTLDPRMTVQFCSHGRCYGHSLDDANCLLNTQMRGMLKGWCSIAPKLYTYEYFVSTCPLYVCRETTEPRDLRYYKSLGLMGWKEEAFFSDATFTSSGKEKNCPDVFPSNWQWLYLTGHLLWDTSIDENALLADAESKYYGAAYTAMAKYHALRRRLWRNNRQCMGYPNGDSRRPTLLDAPGSQEELLGYLDEAEALAAGDSVRLNRISLDRKFLTTYWIAPHVAASSDGCLHASRRTTPVTLDGVGDEGAWAGCTSVTNLLDADGAAITGALGTSFSALYDDDSLYFLVDALEPDTVRSGDGVELFLDPPSTNSNVRYRIAVGADGATWGGTVENGRIAGDLGVTAAAKSSSGHWRLEIKIPAANIQTPLDGDTWRAVFRRNCANRTDATKAPACYSTCTGAVSDVATYIPMDLGKVYLKNGSFRTLKSGTPPMANNWSGGGVTTAVAIPFGKGYAISLGSYIYQVMAHDALAQSSSPRAFTYAVRARGSGTLYVRIIRYTDVYDPKVANGYTRQMYSPQTLVIGTHELTSDSRTYSGYCEIPANQWYAIAMFPSSSTVGIVVESVTVRPQNTEYATLRQALDACGDGETLLAYSAGGETPVNGAACLVAVDGFVGEAAELTGYVKSESDVRTLVAKLPLPQQDGLVSRPFITADGQLMARYAAAPEFTPSAEVPDPVLFSSNADGISLALQVMNPVKDFWYGLLAADAPGGTFSQTGDAVQHTSSTSPSCNLAAPTSTAAARFYRPAVWFLKP